MSCNRPSVSAQAYAEALSFNVDCDVFQNPPEVTNAFLPIGRNAVLLGVAAVHPSARTVGVDLETFVGRWKENTAKSRVFASSTLTYTFSQDTDGFVVIVRGSVQLRDRVRFDGKDYPTPEIPGRTVSWTKVGDVVYETTIKRDGALIAKGRWILSDGGKRLMQETIPVRVDDKDVTNTTEYDRASGEGNSLLGEWRPISSRAGEPDLFAVTLIDAGALEVFYPRNQGGYTIRPDGKEYVLTGPNSLPDTTTSAEALGPRSVRRTTLRGHVPIFEAIMSVAPDGKTMTVTTRRPGGPDEPSVFVYEKQDEPR